MGFNGAKNSSFKKMIEILKREITGAEKRK